MTSGDAEPSAFGRALSARVTARTAVRRRMPGVGGLVGAVGRSSAGFGRAIGRSTQARPVVVTANLASPRLRPIEAHRRLHGAAVAIGRFILEDQARQQSLRH